jgi:Tol biopolymer transport system component
MKRTLIFILVIFTISLYAQPVENQSVLTIEQVMQGEKFVGYSPSGLFWSQDSQTAYFSWNPEMDTLNSMYKVSVDGGPPEKVGLEDEMALPSRFGTYSKDFRYYLYPQNGDLFLLDNNSGTTTQITNTLDRESNPVFSGDESAMSFLQKAIIYTPGIEAQGWWSSLHSSEKEAKERLSSSRSPEQRGLAGRATDGVV